MNRYEYINIYINENVEDYKLKCIDYYKEGCKYCKTEIININMTIDEIENILKDIIRNQDKIYHRECYKEYCLDEIKLKYINEYKEGCNYCKTEIINIDMTIDDIKDKIKEIIKNENNIYHGECYKGYCLDKYKEGCNYCRKEIINNKMTKYEIIDKIKDIIKNQDILLHRKCYELKLQDEYKLKCINEYKKGCNYCKTDIINTNMTVDEIENKIRYIIKNENNIYHRECYEYKLKCIKDYKNGCNYCRNDIINNTDTIKKDNKIYHKECYIIKLEHGKNTDLYKNGYIRKMLNYYKEGCYYCKNEIINKEDDINNIKEKLKNITETQGKIYHDICLIKKHKIEYDKIKQNVV